jgi:hypothetical protein
VASDVKSSKRGDLHALLGHATEKELANKQHFESSGPRLDDGVFGVKLFPLLSRSNKAIKPAGNTISQLEGSSEGSWRRK